MGLNTARPVRSSTTRCYRARTIVAGASLRRTRDGRKPRVLPAARAAARDGEEDADETSSSSPMDNRRRRASEDGLTLPLFVNYGTGLPPKGKVRLRRHPHRPCALPSRRADPRSATRRHARARRRSAILTRRTAARKRTCGRPSALGAAVPGRSMRRHLGTRVHAVAAAVRPQRAQPPARRAWGRGGFGTPPRAAPPNPSPTATPHPPTRLWLGAHSILTNSRERERKRGRERRERRWVR